MLAGGCGSGSPSTVTSTVTRSQTITVTKPGAASSGETATGETATTAAGARCPASSLAVGVVTPPGNGAAGSIFEVLTFRNTGSSACTLAGFPGVSALAAGQQLGSPARRAPVTAKTVTLVPGATARARLQITDVGVFSPARCAPAEATGLRVFPPNDVTSTDVRLAFRACSKAGTIYLSVSPVA